MPGGKQQYWDLPICCGVQFAVAAVICTWLPLQRAACVDLTSVEVLLEGVCGRCRYFTFCFVMHLFLLMI